MGFVFLGAVLCSLQMIIPIGKYPANCIILQSEYSANYFIGYVLEDFLASSKIYILFKHLIPHFVVPPSPTGEGLWMSANIAFLVKLIRSVDMPSKRLLHPLNGASRRRRRRARGASLSPFPGGGRRCHAVEDEAF